MVRSRVPVLIGISLAVLLVIAPAACGAPGPSLSSSPGAVTATTGAQTETAPFTFTSITGTQSPVTTTRQPRTFTLVEITTSSETTTAPASVLPTTPATTTPGMITITTPAAATSLTPPAATTTVGATYKTTTAATTPPLPSTRTTTTSPATSPGRTGFQDGAGDTFDASGKPARAEAFIDIADAGVYRAGVNYQFWMRPNGQVPLSFADPDAAAEWDFFIDTDRAAATGEKNALFTNDTGAEYLLRLLVHGTQVRSELINLSTLQASAVTYTSSGAVVEFSVARSLMGNLSGFNCVALARSWSGGSLAAADKAPEEGHYIF